MDNKQYLSLLKESNSVKEIYTLRADVNRYLGFVSEDKIWERLIIDKEIFDGRSLKKNWKPLKVRLDDKNYEYHQGGYTVSNPKLGDVAGFSGELMIYTESGVKKIGSFLSTCGELLPLICPDIKQKIYLYHVTKVLNILDLEKSDIDYFKNSKDIKYVNKYVFKSEPTFPIFRLGEGRLRFMCLFCTKLAKNKLTTCEGFLFKKVV